MDRSSAPDATFSAPARRDSAVWIEEIAHRIAEKRGYHAAQVNAGSGSNDCARCHSEHNGLNHRLVRWPVPKEKFDHAQAGWKLEGRHAQLKCAECHTAKYIDTADRAVLKRRDLNTTFAGLSASCTACHRDVHIGQLSAHCTDCHSEESWKNPPEFSHARARYPLTGLHARVECTKCHRAASPGGAVQYRGFVLYQYCASCHQDSHGSAFGAECARCHTTAGWKQILPGNGFDHTRTRFPLTGKHAAVSCKDCHKSENFRVPVAFARCLDCHKDEHGGQFTQRADGGDCRSCHTDIAWKPARFTAADHAPTAYPLLGKHAEVSCAKCHLPKGKQTTYRVFFGSCTACHQDAHNGQFATTHNNRCEDCHVVAGWEPTTYAMAAHNRTTFVLKGAHVAVPCSGCHVPRGADTSYHPAAAHCTDCHRSPHGTLAASLDCETCHSATAWKERGRFDHSRTDFALVGRHAAVDCLACHKPAIENGARSIAFRGAAKEFAGCHQDVHGGQFQTAVDETGCARCHTVLSWRPTEFDHSRHSTSNWTARTNACPARCVTTSGARSTAGRL